MTYPVFATGDALPASDLNAIGLWKIASTTFTASSLVEINNCFSSSFDNYLVTATFFGSNVSSASFRLKTTTAESGAVYDRNGFYWFANAVNGFDAANQTSLFVQNFTSTSTNKSAGSMTLYNVNKAEQTAILSQFSDYTGQFITLNHRVETTTQYTGLQLYNSTGGQTITGSIAVYGYRA